MKALPKNLLPLTVFAIAVTSLFSVQPAQAFTITLEQMGSNVVATGSGAFNTAGLTFLGISAFASSSIVPNTGRIITGAASSQVNAPVNVYTGITGPTNFGIGGPSLTSGAGDLVGIGGLTNNVYLPLGYVSGTALSDSATYINSTFASLGVTPGTYVWSWGTGANQNFTLIIGGAGVPDGGSTVSLLGCALLGLAALRRKLSC